jgi:hypothetical protein
MSEPQYVEGFVLVGWWLVALVRCIIGDGGQTAEGGRDWSEIINSEEVKEERRSC